jgi:hypothetical protein
MGTLVDSILAIVDNAVVNMGCRYLIDILISLGYIPSIGLLAHMAVLFLIC